MIDLTNYPVLDNGNYEKEVTDLLAISNAELTDNIESVVVSESGNVVSISGNFTRSDYFAVMGGELVYVESATVNGGNTYLTVKRNQRGTISEVSPVGLNFRSVIVFSTVTNFKFTNSIGAVTNNLFPCEVSTGSVTFIDDPKNWTQFSATRQYKARVKKSCVYIFKGFNGQLLLKHTTVVNKVKYNTRGKTDPNKITLSLSQTMYRYYNEDVTSNITIKDATPKQFFSYALGIPEEKVLYANGNTEDSFFKIDNIHTSNYNKISDLLKAYCSNGFRIIFDRFERLLVFSDLKVESLTSSNSIKYDLSESSLNDDMELKYNAMKIQHTSKLSMYKFSDLNNKYVNFQSIIANITTSENLITYDPVQDIYFENALGVPSDALFTGSKVGDYVALGIDDGDNTIVYCKVVDKISPNITQIVPFSGDKDRNLLVQGKYEYLYSKFIGAYQVDLLFNIVWLPEVFRYTYTFTDGSTSSTSGDSKTSYMMIPLLPKVDGEASPREVSFQFGSASNLQYGEYAGYCEEIDTIFGIWGNDRLLYNNEYLQFNNTIYPPVSVISNKIEEDANGVMKYTTFDNQNFELEIIRGDSGTSDNTMIMTNTTEINSALLITDSALDLINNRIIEVASLAPYSIGDVLTVNPLDNPTEVETREYEEILQDIRWRVTHKIDDGSGFYIQVDSNFPEGYSWTRYPNTSIVYLNELYMRGNPVIKFTEEVNGYSTRQDSEGDSSEDLFGELNYNFSSEMISKTDVKTMMGYVLDNFDGIDLDSTKFICNIRALKTLGIETLDIIEIEDTINTGITFGTKWLVLSETINDAIAGGVEYEYTLMNLNKTDAQPYPVTIQDILQYRPVDIPDYSNNGDEGQESVNQDTESGDKDDYDVGRLATSNIDKELFNAKIDRVDGGYIYFKDFAGTEKDEYLTALFPVSEFIVIQNGEMILVRSDSEYRALILKRGLSETAEIEIQPNTPITFAITSYFVDKDGTLVTRKLYAGDAYSYFKFDPITGAKFVGDFVVGEANQTPDNELYLALQNNRVFRQSTEPVDDQYRTLKQGDVWYDIENNNSVYVYDGSVWQLSNDTTANRIFRQPTEPVSDVDYELRSGDTWFDTDELNKPYYYDGTNWVSVQDGSIDGTAGNKIWFLPSEPPVDPTRPFKEGDLWYDTDEGNIPYTWNGTAWEDARDEGVKTALGNARIFFQDDEPVSGGLFRESTSTTEKIEILDIEEGYKATLEVDEVGTLQYLSVYRTFYEPNEDYTFYWKVTAGQQYFKYVGILSDVFGTSEYITDTEGLVTRTANTTITGSQHGFLVYFVDSSPIGAQIEIEIKLNGGDTIAYTLKNDDLWYDTNDDNHPYIYQNQGLPTEGWQSARDGSIITASGNRIFVQDTEPPSTDRKFGDLWYDSSDGNQPYTWNGSDWINTRDEGVTLALQNSRTFYQNTEPTTGMAENDTWVDTDNGNRVYIYSGGAWVDAQDSEIADALGNNRTFVQDSVPVDTSEYVIKENDVFVYSGHPYENYGKTHIVKSLNSSTGLEGIDEAYESSETWKTVRIDSSTATSISVAYIRVDGSSTVYDRPDEPNRSYYAQFRNNGTAKIYVRSYSTSTGYITIQPNETKAFSQSLIGVAGSGRVAVYLQVETIGDVLDIEYRRFMAVLGTDKELPYVPVEMLDSNKPYSYTLDAGWQSIQDNSLELTRTFRQDLFPIESSNFKLKNNDLWIETDVPEGGYANLLDKFAVDPYNGSTVTPFNTEIPSSSNWVDIEFSGGTHSIGGYIDHYPDTIYEDDKYYYMEIENKHATDSIQVRGYNGGSFMTVEAGETKTYQSSSSTTTSENHTRIYFYRANIGSTHPIAVRRVMATAGTTRRPYTPTKVVDSNRLYAYSTETESWLPAEDKSLDINRSFAQATEPVSDTNYTLREGDIWIDTDDGNKMYTYEDGSWDLKRDSGILEGLDNTRTFRQDLPPVSDSSYTLKENDLWISTLTGLPNLCSKYYVRGYNDSIVNRGGEVFNSSDEWVNFTSSGGTSTIPIIVEPYVPELLRGNYRYYNSANARYNYIEVKNNGTGDIWISLTGSVGKTVIASGATVVFSQQYTSSSSLNYFYYLLWNDVAGEDMDVDIRRPMVLEIYNDTLPYLPQGYVGNNSTFSYETGEGWVSVQNDNSTDNKTYHQDTPPLQGKPTTLKQGDIWVETNVPVGGYTNDFSTYEIRNHDGSVIDGGDRTEDSSDDWRVLKVTGGTSTLKARLYDDTTQNYVMGRCEIRNNSPDYTVFFVANGGKRVNVPPMSTVTCISQNLDDTYTGTNSLYFGTTLTTGEIDIEYRRVMRIKGDYTIRPYVQDRRIYSNQTYIFGETGSWEVSRDTAIDEGLGNARIFRQDNIPTDTTDYELKDNDVWYDTNDGNKLYVRVGTSWVNTQDGDVVTALGNNKVYRQNSTPTDPDVKDGDLWIDTDEGNRMYVYELGAWQDAQDEDIDTALGNSRLFYQSDIPVSDASYTLKATDRWELTGLTGRGNNVYREFFVYGQSGAEITTGEAYKVYDSSDEWLEFYIDTTNANNYFLAYIKANTVDSTSYIGSGKSYYLEIENTGVNNFRVKYGNLNNHYVSAGETKIIHAWTDEEYTSNIGIANDPSSSIVDLQFRIRRVCMYLNTPINLPFSYDYVDNGSSYTYTDEDGGKWLPTVDNSSSVTNTFYQDTLPYYTGGKRFKNGDVWIETEAGYDNDFPKNSDGISEFRMWNYSDSVLNDEGSYYPCDDTWRSYTTTGGTSTAKARVFIGSSTLDDTFGRVEIRNTGTERMGVYITNPTWCTDPEKNDSGTLWIEPNEYRTYVAYSSDRTGSYSQSIYFRSLTSGDDLSFQIRRLMIVSNTKELRPFTNVPVTEVNRQFIWKDNVQGISGAWELARDYGIVEGLGNARVFRQDAVPTDTSEYIIKENDVWYDTNDGNKLYVYVGTSWVNTQDGAVIEALGNNKVYRQTTQPTDPDVKDGDLWIDLDDGNRLYVYDGSSWENAQDEGIIIGENKSNVFYQTSAPTSTSTRPLKNGDIWIDTTTGQNLKQYSWNGSSWVVSNDSLDKIETGDIILNGNTTVTGTFQVSGDHVQLDADTVINGNFSVGGGNIYLDANTDVNGLLTVYGTDGMLTYDTSSASTALARTYVRGGEIEHQQRTSTANSFVTTRVVKKAYFGSVDITNSNTVEVDLSSVASSNIPWESGFSYGASIQKFVSPVAENLSSVEATIQLKSGTTDTLQISAVGVKDYVPDQQMYKEVLVEFDIATTSNESDTYYNPANDYSFSITEDEPHNISVELVGFQSNYTNQVSGSDHPLFCYMRFKKSTETYTDQLSRYTSLDPASFDDQEKPFEDLKLYWTAGLIKSFPDNTTNPTVNLYVAEKKEAWNSQAQGLGNRVIYRLSYNYYIKGQSSGSTTVDAKVSFYAVEDNIIN